MQNDLTTKSNAAIFALVLCCSVAGSGAQAGSDGYPDLLGTWKGTSEAVVLGDPMHTHGNPDLA